MASRKAKEKTKAKLPSSEAQYVVLYIRVSTVEQAEKDLSIPAQEKSLRDWAAARGMTIVAIYIEPGDSARDENRPQFQLMIGDLLNGTTNATAVLVAHTSRFMRNVEANFVYRKKLERKGIRVISIMQEMDDTPTGKLMEIIFAAFDQYESDMNAYRTMAAMRQNARGGNFNGSKAPYGFAIEKTTTATGKTSRGKLVAHPEEAAIGRLVFSLCIDGKGAKAIAHELNRRAVPYRTRSWSKDDVVRVLDEEAAVGTYRWGKWDTSRNEKRDPSEWIAIDVEPFLEREVFNLAQVVRREREPSRSPGRTASSPLLLAGLVKCGKCGGTYSKETSGKTSTGQHPHAYYNCSRFLRLRKGACSGKRVRVNVLDRLVVDHLADKLFTTERCRALATDLIDSSGVLRRKVDDRRELLRSQIEQVDRRITRWETSFETGAKDLDVVAPRLRELRTEREKLTVTLNDLKPLDAPPEHLLTDATIAQFQATIRDIFISADTPMTKGYLRFLVERIVVLDNSVEIRGKTANALALMARAPDLDSEEINHPEAVLAKGGGWLRVRRSLRTLSVNGFGTDSDVRTDPRRRSHRDSENLRRECWDRFAASHCPIVSPSPRDRVPSGHVERKRGVPAPRWTVAAKRA